MPAQNIEHEFPRLPIEGYAITSPETDDYNCIAWAGDDAAEKWDPDPTSGRYWPDGVTRSLQVESFIELYRVEGGYIPCDDDEDGTLEEGIEKIAIFWNLSKEVTHAARQLPSGRWTSKLGDWEDVEHVAPTGVEGVFYGRVAKFLKRKRITS